MGTFLTNPKMSPALRARVEASVCGRSAGKTPTRRRAARVLSLRLGVAVAAICLVSIVAAGVKQSRTDLVKGRNALVARVSSVDRQITADERRLPAKVSSALAEGSRSYPGDRVLQALRTAGLEATLKRPTVYVRAELDEVTRGATIPAIAEDSHRDVLSSCLPARPTSGDEAALLTLVGRAYRNDESTVGRWFRLHDALVVLSTLNPDWESRVAQVSNTSELRALDASFNSKLLARALPAVKAELLVYVLDEPKKPGTITEIDGAREHAIRIGIVDLETEELLLRYRGRVDPAQISERNRARFARGLCDCRFAFELYAKMGGG